MAKFICPKCKKIYNDKTTDGFCDNQPDCEYGSGFLVEAPEIESSGTSTEIEATSLEFQREVGLCILMMDGSYSMADPAFPSSDFAGTKYDLIARNASGGIWSLKNLTHSSDAFIALCVFAGEPKLLWVKNILEIIEEFGSRQLFADFIHQALEKETLKQKSTNITSAIQFAHDIYQSYLKGDLTDFAGINDFKPLLHQLARQKEGGMEDFITLPNARVLIYTDGEHNVTAPIRNPFEQEEQSILLSAFIGEEESGSGIKQMEEIANICPRHAPTKGFFLFDNPERMQILKGLFRMASGASGFCPSCLLVEQTALATMSEG